MKKSHGLLIGFAVIAIAAMGTLAGCDDGSTEPVVIDPVVDTYTGAAGGTTYTLKITDNTTYVLTVGDKTSSGTAVQSGSTFTLTPTGATVTFTVTVSGSGITGMSGTITYSDESIEDAPTTLTPPPAPPNNSPITFISITTSPTKKTYKVGETLDLTGMVVTAYHEDGTTSANFTAYTLSSDYEGEETITAGESGTALAASGETDPRVYIYVWANGKRTYFDIIVVKAITADYLARTWGYLYTDHVTETQSSKTTITVDGDNTVLVIRKQNHGGHNGSYYITHGAQYGVTLTIPTANLSPIANIGGDAANQGITITGGTLSNVTEWDSASDDTKMKAAFGDNGNVLASSAKLVVNQVRSLDVSGNPIWAELRLYYGSGDDDYVVLGKSQIVD